MCELLRVNNLAVDTYHLYSGSHEKHSAIRTAIHTPLPFADVSSLAGAQGDRRRARRSGWSHSKVGSDPVHQREDDEERDPQGRHRHPQISEAGGGAGPVKGGPTVGPYDAQHQQGLQPLLGSGRRGRAGAGPHHRR